MSKITTNWDSIDFVTFTQFIYAIAYYEISLVNTIFQMTDIFHEISESTTNEYTNKVYVKHVIPKIGSFFIDENGILKPHYINPIKK